MPPCSKNCLFRQPSPADGAHKADVPDVMKHKKPDEKLSPGFFVPAGRSPSERIVCILRAGRVQRTAVSTNSGFEGHRASRFSGKRVIQFPDQDLAAFAVVLKYQATVAV